MASGELGPASPSPCLEATPGSLIKLRFLVILEAMLVKAVAIPILT